MIAHKDLEDLMADDFNAAKYLSNRINFEPVTAVVDLDPQIDDVDEDLVLDPPEIDEDDLTPLERYKLIEEHNEWLDDHQIDQMREEA